MSDGNLFPTPLERLQAPFALNGEAGTNRAPSFVTKHIGAVNDLQAIYSWLAEFEDSPETYRTYRKEAERLLMWALIEKQKAFSSLTRDDLRDYQRFLANPEPRARWCGERKPRHHPDWRPFRDSLSERSIGHALTITNALLTYLVDAGYLSGNPLGLMRHKFNRQEKMEPHTMERFLEKELFHIVMSYIESLPQSTPRQQKEYERTRYLFHLLYLLAPRVSEITNAKMKTFKQVRGKWWWEVTGKGKKTTLIPVNQSMLDALMRYRLFYQLPSLPQVGDDQAIFMNLNGTKGITNNMIYRLVKDIFLQCAEHYKPTRPDYEAKLKKASTHWMRHTSITHQAEAKIDPRFMQKTARHENFETTMHYVHVEDDRWHEEMEKHTI